MTRETVEKIVRGITDKIECNTVDIDEWARFWGFTREEYEEFLEWSIKAVEQEAVLDKIKSELKEWYWQVDKQALAKDPCVVDAMIDLFIRTIDEYKAESEKA